MLDFAYNMLYFRGIRDCVVEHPYRLEDQEKLIRKMLPDAASGRTHAYSPVAFVLAQPLLGLPGRDMYLTYLILNGLGIALLYYGCLLPRAKSALQYWALTLCALSVWFATTLAVGQSSLLTTTLLGVMWFLLNRREQASPVMVDVFIAILFWAICMKPSVAIIPFMLLLAARAWRVLAMGMGLLLVTWLVLGGYYGGRWTGLLDYAYLLNHYHDAAFTPFLRTVTENAQLEHQTIVRFAIDRDLLLFSSLALLLLRWFRRITGSEHFQGMVWAFLLFSPYLMPSENLILCLLVVEGTFFRSTHPGLVIGKLLLLAAILNLRANIDFPGVVDSYLKWALFAWVLAEWFVARRNKNADDLGGESLHTDAIAWKENSGRQLDLRP
jgi:hypothetical protein